MEKDEIPIIENKRFDIKLVHISDSLRRQFPESCSRGRPPYPPSAVECHWACRDYWSVKGSNLQSVNKIQ